MSGLPQINLCQALRHVTLGTSGFLSRAAIEGGGEDRSHERRSAGHYKDFTKIQNRKLRMIFSGTQSFR